ncbi:MAG: prolyl-tRNA synthetase associated domain-containing protein [Clostridia bacterium]|nr:prolyl-tRNA synthetase associated domain-containing protein [Clostridia bacterium]
MSDTVSEVLDKLDALGIPYRLAEHPPADTMEACAAVDRRLGALTPKNIFLTTKNGRRFCLCLTRPDARFRTADISKQAGFSRLSFAPEEKLYALLRCRGGSASPLGLMFTDAVTLLVDSALRDQPALGFHPCDNTRTVAMAGGDFFDVFLPAVGVKPVFVEVHDFL